MFAVKVNANVNVHYLIYIEDSSYIIKIIISNHTNISAIILQADLRVSSLMIEILHSLQCIFMCEDKTNF